MTSSAIVYVVDDDASVRKAVVRLFRSAELSVEAFETAGAFLAHARADLPGCLILDVQMPGQSGIELQEELAAHGVDLPIVFMTGHGDIPMTVKAMQDGAVDFLPKPVGDEQLLETVKRAIGRHDRSRHRPIFGFAPGRKRPDAAGGARAARANSSSRGRPGGQIGRRGHDRHTRGRSNAAYGSLCSHRKANRQSVCQPQRTIRRRRPRRRSAHDHRFI